MSDTASCSQMSSIVIASPFCPIFVVFINAVLVLISMVCLWSIDEEQTSPAAATTHISSILPADRRWTWSKVHSSRQCQVTAWWRTTLLLLLLLLLFYFIFF